MDGIKSQYPFDIGLFQRQYDTVLAEIESPKQLSIGRVSHSYANKFVEQHHYLKRKIYIARNVSYGLFASLYCVGIAMFGYPIWTQYPGVVPPLLVDECPELIRLATVTGLPRNSESWFLSRCIRAMRQDWEGETGYKPQCIMSFCDLAFGFDGAIYKATNFTFLRHTNGRATNPGGTHGKWQKNTHEQRARKAVYIYWYNRDRHTAGRSQ